MNNKTNCKCGGTEVIKLICNDDEYREVCKTCHRLVE